MRRSAFRYSRLSHHAVCLRPGREVRLRRRVARVVVDHAVTRQDRLAEKPRVLVRPRRAVQPCADDDRDVVAPHAASLQRLEDRRQDHLVRHRPRHVRHDDRGALPRAHHLPQRPPPHRRSDRRPHRGVGVRNRLDGLRQRRSTVAPSGTSASMPCSPYGRWTLIPVSLPRRCACAVAISRWQVEKWKTLGPGAASAPSQRASDGADQQATLSAFLDRGGTLYIVVIVRDRGARAEKPALRG